MTMLPVLATVLVIVAGGRGGSARGPVVVLRHPVALWIGRHSYAIYLWHWPVLVLVEAQYGPLPLPTRLLLVAVAVGLSAASLRLRRGSRAPLAVAGPAGGARARPRRHVVRHGGARRGMAAERRRAARLGRAGRRADACPRRRPLARADDGRRRSSPPPPRRPPRRASLAALPAGDVDALRRRQPDGARAGAGADRRAVEPAPVAARRRCRSCRGLPRRLRRCRAGESQLNAVPLRRRRTPRSRSSCTATPTPPSGSRRSRRSPRSVSSS